MIYHVVSLIWYHMLELHKYHMFHMPDGYFDLKKMCIYMYSCVDAFVCDCK